MRIHAIFLLALTGPLIAVDDLPPVPNPFGFETRLALLDYFKDRGIAIPPDASDLELRQRYRDIVWPNWAGMAAQLDARHIVHDQFESPSHLGERVSKADIRKQIQEQFKIIPDELASLVSLKAQLESLEKNSDTSRIDRLMEENRMLVAKLREAQQQNENLANGLVECRAEVQRLTARIASNHQLTTDVHPDVVSSSASPSWKVIRSMITPIESDITLVGRTRPDGIRVLNGFSTSHRASLTMVGPDTHIQDLCLLVNMDAVDDHVKENIGRMSLLLQGIFPDWTDSGQWLTESLDTALKTNAIVKSVRNGLRVSVGTAGSLENYALIISDE